MKNIFLNGIFYETIKNHIKCKLNIRSASPDPHIQSHFFGNYFFYFQTHAITLNVIIMCADADIFFFKENVTKQINAILI